jgi:hypothetical protein
MLKISNQALLGGRGMKSASISKNSSGPFEEAVGLAARTGSIEILDLRKSTDRYEWVKERWRTADGGNLGRWLLGVPESLRRVDPNAPGIMFLTTLADVISK